MPIDGRKSVSSIIGELVGKYKKTGKIGTSKPENKKQAVKQAAAIAYSTKEKKNEAISLDTKLKTSLDRPDIQERQIATIIITFRYPVRHEIIKSICQDIKETYASLDNLAPISIKKVIRKSTKGDARQSRTIFLEISLRTKLDNPARVEGYLKKLTMESLPEKYKDSKISAMVRNYGERLYMESLSEIGKILEKLKSYDIKKKKKHQCNKK